MHNSGYKVVVKGTWAEGIWTFYNERWDHNYSLLPGKHYLSLPRLLAIHWRKDSLEQKKSMSLFARHAETQQAHGKLSPNKYKLVSTATICQYVMIANSLQKLI